MAWLMFAIAAVVYGLTVEPTASLWDCPEFIACGYKLEIGHPPGAPFFMLAANLFSHLASNPSQVALMVNLLSALLSTSPGHYHRGMRRGRSTGLHLQRHLLVLGS